MSDAIITAIIGAVVAIIAAIISGVFSYRAGKDQGRVSLQIAKEQWKQQQKAQISMLINTITDDFADSLNRTVVKYANDKDEIRRLEIKNAKFIRSLYLRGKAEKKKHWIEAADELSPLMEKYFRMLEQYGAGQITIDEIEAYRTKLKNQVGDILASIQSS